MYVVNYYYIILYYYLFLVHNCEIHSWFQVNTPLVNAQHLFGELAGVTDGFQCPLNSTLMCFDVSFCLCPQSSEDLGH